VLWCEEIIFISVSSSFRLISQFYFHSSCYRLLMQRFIGSLHVIVEIKLGPAGLLFPSIVQQRTRKQTFILTGE